MIQTGNKRPVRCPKYNMYPTIYELHCKILQAALIMLRGLSLSHMFQLCQNFNIPCSSRDPEQILLKRRKRCDEWRVSSEIVSDGCMLKPLSSLSTEMTLTDWSQKTSKNVEISSLCHQVVKIRMVHVPIVRFKFCQGNLIKCPMSPCRQVMSRISCRGRADFKTGNVNN